MSKHGYHYVFSRENIFLIILVIVVVVLQMFFARLSVAENVPLPNALLGYGALLLALPVTLVHLGLFLGVLSLFSPFGINPSIYLLIITVALVCARFTVQRYFEFGSLQAAILSLFIMHSVVYGLYFVFLAFREGLSPAAFITFGGELLLNMILVSLFVSIGYMTGVFRRIKII